MQISRGTVHKYHEIAKEKGYLEKADVQPSESELQEALGAGVQPPRQTSTVEPYREKIQDWVKQGVEMTAIWLRLQENFSYKGGYSSIRRFVHNLEPGEPEAFVRVHSEPGEDMQVDFGSVGQLYDPVSKRLRTAYVFVATLGYSRHQYAELVFDQKVATWIALHKRAFAYFGGVPKRVIPDNLKAAVLKVLVHDPILGEAYRRMALYYGFLVSPTIPYTPRHKGKVENGVHYVKRNFFAGQEFVDINMGNLHLRDWIVNTAGVRKHGTTGEAPLHLFNEFEKACLQPLPAEPFRLLEIRPVTVHPDCHVVITGSFYSVPFGYIGQELAAHVSENFVDLDSANAAEKVETPATGETATDPANELFDMEKIILRIREILAALPAEASEELIEVQAPITIAMQTGMVDASSNGPALSWTEWLGQYNLAPAPRSGGRRKVKVEEGQLALF
jgi:transposase